MSPLGHQAKLSERNIIDTKTITTENTLKNYMSKEFEVCSHCRKAKIVSWCKKGRQLDILVVEEELIPFLKSDLRF